MKAAMLFPGQGSQFIGMGKDYYDGYAEVRALYKDANQKLGFDITALSFSGDIEELTQTRNLQPAILLHSIAILAVLEGRGVRPSVVAGHSLGELAALVAAGFLRPMDALLIGRRRGELMYEAGLERQGSMAAIIGPDTRVVEDCVQQVTEGVVVVANYNSPEQHAISGDVEAVDRACEICKEAGAKRTLKLPVSGAFHSPLMEPAAGEFRRFLGKFSPGRLCVPWVANVTAEVEGNPASVMDLLARQLSSAVRWSASMCVFARHVEGPVYEVGPGKVLTGLMKRTEPGVEVQPLSDVEALA